MQLSRWESWHDFCNFYFQSIFKPQRQADAAFRDFNLNVSKIIVQFFQQTPSHPKPTILMYLYMEYKNIVVLFLHSYSIPLDSRPEIFLPFLSWQIGCNKALPFENFYQSWKQKKVSRLQSIEHCALKIVVNPPKHLFWTTESAALELCGPEKGLSPITKGGFVLSS